MSKIDIIKYAIENQRLLAVVTPLSDDLIEPYILGEHWLHSRIALCFRGIVGGRFNISDVTHRIYINDLGNRFDVHPDYGGYFPDPSHYFRSIIAAIPLSNSIGNPIQAYEYAMDII